MTKLFSSALRNGLNSWCEKENVYNASQFGLRDNHGKTDCIFILNSIIQNVIKNIEIVQRLSTTNNINSFRHRYSRNTVD